MLTDDEYRQDSLDRLKSHYTSGIFLTGLGIYMLSVSATGTFLPSSKYSTLDATLSDFLAGTRPLDQTRFVMGLAFTIFCAVYAGKMYKDYFQLLNTEPTAQEQAK